MSDLLCYYSSIVLRARKNRERSEHVLTRAIAKIKDEQQRKNLMEKWQYSSWEKDTRFYLLELCQDIFGNWIIKRTWGSAVKLDFCCSNSTVYSDYQTGLLWYEKQASRRQKRGYVSKDKLSQN